MYKTILSRIIIDLIILITVLEGWWFITIPVGIIGAWIFTGFIELFIAGIIYDALFNLNTSSGWMEYIGTITTTITTLIVTIFKKNIRL